MSTEIRVPQLPESVADATLVAWRKKPGEAECHGQDDIEHDAQRLESDEQQRPSLLAQP